MTPRLSTTGDSVTYLAEDAAFIGDTLFAPAFGTARCDFPGGQASQLYDSIRKLYELPEETRLFLCHDYPVAGEEPMRDVTVKESLLGNIQKVILSNIKSFSLPDANSANVDLVLLTALLRVALNNPMWGSEAMTLQLKQECRNIIRCAGGIPLDV